MTPEQIIQTQILDYLRTLHFFCWRNNTRCLRVGGRLMQFGKVGSADILGILKPSGRFLAIEVKKPGEKPSDEQIAFLWAIRDAGGVAIVAYSLDDVRKVLYPSQVK